MRLAMVGKGGAGKSVIGGTLARLLARRGYRVLALDSDHVPGLTFSLGAVAPAEPPLAAAVEVGPDMQFRFIHGVGAVRAIQRYATDAPDGVRLLQAGKALPDGRAPLRGAIEAFYVIIHRLSATAAFRDWVVIGDLSAGAQQAAYEWAPYAERFLLVVEPTWQSMLTARRIKRIVTGARPDVEVSLIVNKATGQADSDRVASFLALPVVAAVPVDEGVRKAELEGVALLDIAPNGPAVHAIEQLTDRLRGDRLR
jgi:CO dehydrogenase maturation factor